MNSTKVDNILKTKEGQDAIIAIEEILFPIYDTSPEKLSHEEMNFILIEELERQVNSGGFNSFFSYSYGNLAKETLYSLKEIGSIKFKRILEKAMDVFNNSTVPQNEEERFEVIEENEEEFDEVWDLLDDEFYKYEEDIHTLLITYVKENIHQFR